MVTQMTDRALYAITCTAPPYKGIIVEAVDPDRAVAAFRDLYRIPPSKAVVAVYIRQSSGLTLEDEQQIERAWTGR